MVRAAIAGLLVGVLVTANPGRAQDIDPRRLAEVKAGFLLNFVRYTTWPAERLEGARGPLRVAVLGDDAVARALEAIASRAAAAAEGHRVTVERFDSLDSLAPDERDSTIDALLDVHMVYIGDPSDRSAMALIDSFVDRGVLVVGDGAGFAAAGGMIGLWRDGDRVVFDANPGAIRASGIVVSARVLKLARLIQTVGGA
jgi:hypothetical protein